MYKARERARRDDSIDHARRQRALQYIKVPKTSNIWRRLSRQFTLNFRGYYQNRGIIETAENCPNNSPFKLLPEWGALSWVCEELTSGCFSSPPISSLRLLFSRSTASIFRFSKIFSFCSFRFLRWKINYDIICIEICLDLDLGVTT